MKELNRKFYLKGFREDRQQSYFLLANIIMEVFAPQSVIDMGCGLGWVLYYLKRHFSLSDLVGIEPNPEVQHLMPEEVSGLVWPYTLTTEIDLGRKFDLAVSLEVVEHFEEKYADVAIDNITRHSDVVMFSAAHPGQNGVGHMNEQDKYYWREKFKLNGFYYDEETTAPIIATLRNYNAKWWYIANTMVLKRKLFEGDKV